MLGFRYTSENINQEIMKRMIDENILNYILIFMALELYEVLWQKANTLIGMLARMYQHYHKSVFIFLLMHPTFYFLVFFMMLNDFNIYAVILLGIKTMDISMKLILIKQVFIDKEISSEMSMMLLMPLHKFLPYIGLVAYPPLIYMALT